jgi:hypothetical protein
MGVAAGLAWANADLKDEQHRRDLEQQRDALRRNAKTELYQSAFKHAAAEVLDEIVEELKQEQAGSLPRRRMSDPKNTDLRNEVYAEAAAKNVERLSGGKVRMSRMSKDRIKNDRKFR